MTRYAVLSPRDRELREAGLLELLDYVAPVTREDVKRDVELVLSALGIEWSSAAAVADAAGLELERTNAILESLLEHVGDVDRAGDLWRLMGGHGR